MNGLRIALLVINSLISSAGIVANLVLLIIISVATPKPIRTYSVLIVNYAVTDLFTSLAQALTVPRLITENGSFLLVFYGACSEISSRTCLYSFFVETFGFSHGLNSILLSICYRYFSLRYGVPKRKPIIILCFITCLPSLVPMLVLCQKWANESTVANLIAKYRSDMYDEGLAVAEPDCIRGDKCRNQTEASSRHGGIHYIISSRRRLGIH
ncbi:hypothetical protein ANCCEY_11256 [Ancylostoma ceylanicum]|uniref:G-protein coupled receptors family 1 profile domain-containing protein n=1 Tax=Ancylostoma ceylanicum TaxID=53326 RepID=A0A0D6LCP0_9BILA|nr:hypothetical protein ANCCEY_11256 [Ancylostoma ceylanicum]